MTEETRMQISATTAAQLPSASTAATAAVPKSEITRKSEMSGDPVIDLARGFGNTMLLTDSDRAMIERVTGVKMDAETGRTLSTNVPPEVADFINALADKRVVEYQNQQPSLPLDETSVRDLFKQAVEEGHPLNPNIMQKMLDVLSGAIDSKSNAKASDKPDAANDPASSAPQGIDQYA
jgi:hypothetical protein